MMTSKQEQRARELAHTECTIGGPIQRDGFVRGYAAAIRDSSVLIKALEHIQSQCGIPNANYALRKILETAGEIISAWNRMEIKRQIGNKEKVL